jgi:Protein of unknown function (DUF5818)
MKSFVIRLSLAAALTLSLLALAQPSHAQEPSSQAPAATTPPDQQSPSAQDQQTPAAAPPDTTQSSPSSQSPQQQNEPAMPAAGDDAQTPSAQAFTGRIMKEDGKVVLKDPVTKTSYQIDDTTKVKPFMGKQVKVTGKLDMNSNTLHIETIAPLS